MSGSIKCFDRSRQILALLKIHGPLSFRVIRTLLRPAIKTKKLHAALSRLAKAKLIDKRYEKLFGGSGVFYQISQDSQNLTGAAKLLQCQPDDLEQPEFRYRELLHTQACAIWSHALKVLYPTARIIRDFEFMKHTTAKQWLSVTDQEPELRPDMLLILPGTTNEAEIAVAIEIERTRKTHKRVIEKLNKYANETFIDGVIYVCSEKRIIETVRALYERQIAPTNTRVKHYAQHFFMFSEELDIHNFSLLDVYNSKLKCVSLKTWIAYLRASAFNFRRDGKIETRGNPLPHV